MKKYKISNKDLQLLSNYLDGQLTAAQQLKVAARLQKEPALSTALAELKQTRYLIKKAQARVVPRNFTLTPAIAAQLKPAKRPFALPLLSISSVMAAILMVFAILVEGLPASNLSQFMKNAPGNEISMDSAAEEMQTMAAPAGIEEVENGFTLDLRDLQGNPPIINWGGNAYGSGGGMGGGNDLVEGLGGDSPTWMEEPVIDLPPLDSNPDQPVMDLPPLDIIPEQSATEPPPVEEAPLRITAKSMPDPITGTGPILGIPSEEETAAYNQTVFDILEQEKQSYKQLENQIPPIRFLQWGFGLIALSTALAAVWLFRKSSL
jgi:hypothetical protein